jgi:hypothetical protein
MQIEGTILSRIKRSGVVRGAAAIVAVCAPFLASAQMRSLDSTRNGNGTLNFASRSSSNRISRVRVYLNSNHRADVVLLSGARETISGTWQSSGLTKVYLTIDKFGGDSATGTGQVVHDARGEFVSVFCSGMVRDRKFDFRFDTDTFIGGGSGNGDGGSYRGFQITSPRDGSRVDSANVDIEGTSRGKRVNVKVYDDARHVVADETVNVKQDKWSTRVRVDRGTGIYRVAARDIDSRGADNISFSFGRGGRGSGDVTDTIYRNNAKNAIRDRFRGYTIDFRPTTVGREILGSRTVKGDFTAKGRGDRHGDYRMIVVCAAGTGNVKSVDYVQK